MIERQELYCHGCGNYVQFDLDLSIDGQYELNCPVCGHVHCRVVKDGIITDERWDSRNASVFTPMNITWTVSSTYDTYQGSSAGSTANIYLYSSWMNSTSTNITFI